MANELEEEGPSYTAQSIRLEESNSSNECAGKNF
jgi:hypothetical protein